METPRRVIVRYATKKLIFYLLVFQKGKRLNALIADLLSDTDSYGFLWKKRQIYSKKQQAKYYILLQSPVLKKDLKNYGGGGESYYITADLYKKAMVRMDITDILYPDETFDIILCNHVLEHVTDDIKAMREFFRVLKKDGWAILLVPIADMDKTYEDSSIVSEVDRLRAFGQGDHVRKYGRDYIDRLRSVGFNVKKMASNDLLDDETIKSMAIKEDTDQWGFIATEIYYCKKSI
jgi:predicted SAM-dependent methyltransferase